MRLAEVLEQTALTNLVLDDCNLLMEGACALADAMDRAPTLTALHLSRNDIGQDGAHAIALALPDSQLTELSLMRNALMDVGVAACALALPGTLLTSLDLRSNSLTHDGVKILAEVLPQTRLARLKLSGAYASVMALLGACFRPLGDRISVLRE